MGKGAVQVRAPVAVHRAAGGLAQAEGVEAVVARPAAELALGQGSSSRATISVMISLVPPPMPRIRLSR